MSNKIILNVSLESEELEDKVKIAIDKYIMDVAKSELNPRIKKYVDQRIDELLNGGPWGTGKRILGKTLFEYVSEATERNVGDLIELKAKEILKNKLAELL